MKYTDEQKQMMIKEYAAGAAPEAIASMLDTSARSIIAVLSRAKVYKKQTYTPKYGDTVYTKEQLVTLIEAEAKVTATAFEGLEKAPKHVLFKILELLRNAKSPQ